MSRQKIPAETFVGASAGVSIWPSPEASTGASTGDSLGASAGDFYRRPHGLSGSAANFSQKVDADNRFLAKRSPLGMCSLHMLNVARLSVAKKATIRHDCSATSWPVSCGENRAKLLTWAFMKCFQNAHSDSALQWGFPPLSRPFFVSRLPNRGVFCHGSAKSLQYYLIIAIFAASQPGIKLHAPVVSQS